MIAPFCQRWKRRTKDNRNDHPVISITSHMFGHMRKVDSFASSPTVRFPPVGLVKTGARLSKSLSKVRRQGGTAERAGFRNKMRAGFPAAG